MDTPMKLHEDVDSWSTVIFLYNSALKEVGTKLEILNDEFQHVHQYNPIEYIKRRIKTPESIVKKLKRNGYEVSIDNMVNHVNDIAGIRIVCSFTSDIYRLAEMIGKQNDLTVVSIKDYIKHPKESGYKSFHMLVTVPIFLSDRVVDTKVEIQIRTMAMDFWASLEHKIYYKFEGNAPEYISSDLKDCSEIVSMLDAKMLQLNEAILEAKAQEQEHHNNEQRCDSVEQYQHRVIAGVAHNVNAELLIEVPAALYCTERAEPSKVRSAGIYHESDERDLRSEICQTLDDLSAEKASRAHDDVRELCERSSMGECAPQPCEAASYLLEEPRQRTGNTSDEIRDPLSYGNEKACYLNKYFFVPRENIIIKTCHCSYLLRSDQ